MASWHPQIGDVPKAAVRCCKHIQDRGRKGPRDVL